MRLLIKAGADVDFKGTMIAPLMFAASLWGYTNVIKFLLKAGANLNVPDDLGWLPVEYAASRNCREEVEMLFPLTSPIPNVPNWSVDGIISHAKIKHIKPLHLIALEEKDSVLCYHAYFYPNVQPEFPVVDMEDPYVVCFLLDEGYPVCDPDATTWMIKVHMKKKILLDCTGYSKKGSSSRHNTYMTVRGMSQGRSFISSEMPCCTYLDKP